MYILADKRKATHNSTLAIGGVSSPLDSFVVAESFVLRINICGRSPTFAKPKNVIANANRPPCNDNPTKIYLELVV
jgi:hypothetical protein